MILIMVGILTETGSVSIFQLAPVSSEMLSSLLVTHGRSALAQSRRLPADETQASDMVNRHASFGGSR